MTARTKRPQPGSPAHRPREQALRIAEGLRATAGLLLLLALVFAPWCWGCAWPGGIRSLDLMLLPAIACWLGAALLRRERSPRLLMLLCSLLLLQGWGMTLNSRAIFLEATALFAPLEQPLEGWPGSVERDLSLETMPHVTCLLGAALVAASLGRECVWRRRICVVIGLTAVSIVLLGCAQHWGGATDIFWGPRRLDYFFASFRNVTSAGEYLNLAAPLAMAAAWLARDRAPVLKAAAVCALAIVVAGSLICGSKAAPILTAALAAIFVWTKRGEMGGGTSSPARSVVVAVALIAAVVLMTWGAGWGVTQDRWQRFLVPAGEATVADRLRVDQVCVAAASDAGWFGFGPGTFPAVYRQLQAESPNAPDGRWLAAHDDYLQTELGWGLTGTLAWSMLLFVPLGLLVKGLRSETWRGEDRIWALGLALALSGTALMALVDFPWQVASLQLEVAVLLGLGWSSFSWPKARARAT